MNVDSWLDRTFDKVHCWSCSFSNQNIAFSHDHAINQRCATGNHWMLHQQQQVTPKQFQIETQLGVFQQLGDVLVQGKPVQCWFYPSVFS